MLDYPNCIQILRNSEHIDEDIILSIMLCIIDSKEILNCIDLHKLLVIILNIGPVRKIIDQTNKSFEKLAYDIFTKIFDDTFEKYKNLLPHTYILLLEKGIFDDDDRKVRIMTKYDTYYYDYKSNGENILPETNLTVDGLIALHKIAQHKKVLSQVMFMTIFRYEILTSGTCDQCMYYLKKVVKFEQNFLGFFFGVIDNKIQYQYNIVEKVKNTNDVLEKKILDMEKYLMNIQKLKFEECCIDEYLTHIDLKTKSNYYNYVKPNYTRFRRILQFHGSTSQRNNLFFELLNRIDSSELTNKNLKFILRYATHMKLVLGVTQLCKIIMRYTDTTCELLENHLKKHRTWNLELIMHIVTRDLFSEKNELQNLFVKYNGSSTPGILERIKNSDQHISYKTLIFLFDNGVVPDADILIKNINKYDDTMINYIITKIPYFSKDYLGIIRGTFDNNDKSYNPFHLNTDKIIYILEMLHNLTFNQECLYRYLSVIKYEYADLEKIKKIISPSIMFDEKCFKIFMNNEERNRQSSYYDERNLKIIISCGCILTKNMMEYAIMNRHIVKDPRIFNVSFDEAYDMYHKYRNFPHFSKQLLKQLPNITQKKILTRYLWLTTRSIKHIPEITLKYVVSFMKKNNVILDQYCIDNAYISQNLKRIEYMEKLDKKPNLEVVARLKPKTKLFIFDRMKLINCPKYSANVLINKDTDVLRIRNVLNLNEEIKIFSKMDIIGPDDSNRFAMVLAHVVMLNIQIDETYLFYLSNLLKRIEKCDEHFMSAFLVVLYEAWWNEKHVCVIDLVLKYLADVGITITKKFLLVLIKNYVFENVKLIEYIFNKYPEFKNDFEILDAMCINIKETQITPTLISYLGFELNYATFLRILNNNVVPSYDKTFLDGLKNNRELYAIYHKLGEPCPQIPEHPIHDYFIKRISYNMVVLKNMWKDKQSNLVETLEFMDRHKIKLNQFCADYAFESREKEKIEYIKKHKIKPSIDYLARIYNSEALIDAMHYLEII